MRRTATKSLEAKERKRGSPARTRLGRRLLKWRQRILASGQPLLDWEHLEAELRGESHGRYQSFPAAAKETRTMNEQGFPMGWDEQRVQQLIAELDARTDEASAANADDQTVITVPNALLPEIRRLLASHKTA